MCMSKCVCMCVWGGGDMSAHMLLPHTHTGNSTLTVWNPGEIWVNMQKQIVGIFTYSMSSHVQLTLKVLKFKILNFKTLNCFGYVLFNTSIAQHVPAYLAIIKCIKIDGGIAALLYTIVTHINTFSYFYNLVLNSEVCMRSICYRLEYFLWWCACLLWLFCM
jgi:hypothetical protein